MIIFHGYSLLQVSNILNQTPAIPGIEVLAGIGTYDIGILGIFGYWNWY